MNELVTIAFIGDVMLGRGVSEQIKVQASAGSALLTPESFWGNVLPILQGADAVIANLECAITEHDQEYRRVPKVFHFRADPAAVDVLCAANIRCVNLANNHILDFEEQGLLDTLHYLDTAGIHHVGAGRDINDAIAPVVMEIAGLKVGLIAITDNQPDFAARVDHPGTNYQKICSDSMTLAWIESAVLQLQQAGAQLIILSAHWGPNMVTSPSPQFYRFARKAIDSGVDIFYGHSAHIFQAVEHFHNGLILYDTGDFLDDYIVDPRLRNDWSFVFLVEVDSGGLHWLRLIPVCIDYARVELAKEEAFTAICQRMQLLCAAFNTEIQQTSEGLKVKLRNSSV
ncbi:poly-gamma-glutamate biosynthesis protein [Nostocales cyanobacterium HT-58-2]|nr:poly-gamma-glutamate biosynthesis protein [Nostocales cyanobacterium HT-58-2]